MTRRAPRLAILAAALLAACHQGSAGEDADHALVDPLKYDAFYVWPGVRPPAGARPKTLYLLDGEIRRAAPARFTRLRLGAPRLPGVELWLVVRVERLDWDAAAMAAIVEDLSRWRRAGNRVAGLQVDFDAATRGVASYRRFLAGLRSRLGREDRLSITGLLDWSAHGDPHELIALGSIIDEVVVQTYQGRATIPGYQDYFRRMGEFPIPFRVALAEGGRWRAPEALAGRRQFRGYVVFLLLGRGDGAPSAGLRR